MIPRDYPEVSSKVVDKTVQGSLKFVEECATLTIQSVYEGWSIEPDKELVKCDPGVHCPENDFVCLFVRSLVMKLINLRWQVLKQRNSTTTLPG